MYNVLHIPTGYYLYFISRGIQHNVAILDTRPFGILEPVLECNVSFWALNNGELFQQPRTNAEFEYIEVDPFD